MYCGKGVRTFYIKYKKGCNLGKFWLLPKPQKASKYPQKKIYFKLWNVYGKGICVFSKAI